MTRDEYDKAIEEIKEICRYIGCTKVSVSLCDNAPHMCKIIAMIMKFVKDKLEAVKKCRVKSQV